MVLMTCVIRLRCNHVNYVGRVGDCRATCAWIVLMADCPTADCCVTKLGAERSTANFAL